MALTLMLHCVSKDGKKVVPIEPGIKKLLLGRGDLLDCQDRKISRSHAVLEIESSGDVYLKSNHVKPSYVYESETATSYSILKKDQKQKISLGQCFSLLPQGFKYKLTDGNGNGAAATPAKVGSEQNMNAAAENPAKKSSSGRAAPPRSSACPSKKRSAKISDSEDSEKVSEKSEASKSEEEEPAAQQVSVKEEVVEVDAHVTPKSKPTKEAKAAAAKSDTKANESKEWGNKGGMSAEEDDDDEEEDKKPIKSAAALAAPPETSKPSKAALKGTRATDHGRKKNVNSPSSDSDSDWGLKKSKKSLPKKSSSGAHGPSAAAAAAVAPQNFPPTPAEEEEDVKPPADSLIPPLAAAVANLNLGTDQNPPLGKIACEIYRRLINNRSRCRDRNFVNDEWRTAMINGKAIRLKISRQQFLDRLVYLQKLTTRKTTYEGDMGDCQMMRVKKSSTPFWDLFKENLKHLGKELVGFKCPIVSCKPKGFKQYTATHKIDFRKHILHDHDFQANYFCETHGKFTNRRKDCSSIN